MAILVLAPSVVLAKGDGVIAGRVENRSPEGVMPAGVTVTLQIFEGQEFDRHETVVSSADGSFVFSALDTEAIFAYRILVDFQGGLFAGDPITFTVTETVNIVVPSSTPSPSIRVCAPRDIHSCSPPGMIAPSARSMSSPSNCPETTP